MTSSGSVTAMLRTMPRSERRRALAQFVAAEVKDSLQIPAAEHLPQDQSVFGLGLTSLGAVELKERLEEQLGCAIDADVLFNHTTVEDLVGYLAEDPLRDLFAGTGSRGDETAASPGGQTATVEAPGAPQGDDPASPKALVDDLLKKLYQA